MTINEIPEQYERKIHQIGGFSKFICIPPKWAKNCKSNKVIITQQGANLIVTPKVVAEEV